MTVRPVTLELPDGVARLEPLEPRHAPGLLDAASDASIFAYMPTLPPRNLPQIEQLLRAALDAAAGGAELPFAIVERATGRPIGSTRYLDIQPANRGLEIGWTWIGRAWQRTRVNTECKFLLLRHAFDSLAALRVQFKTDERNRASRAALLRIGAVVEGTLRKHRIMPDGFVRSSVYFSVLAEEWPAVRQRLTGLLAAPRSPAAESGG